jgi:uncharacterized protein (TIGR02231 family)
MCVAKKMLVCLMCATVVCVLALQFGAGAAQAADPDAATVLAAIPPTTLAAMPTAVPATVPAPVTTAAKDDEKIINGRVTDVTLYRGQALVTRSIPLDGVMTNQPIVVSNLPEQVVSGSLFAEGAEATQIRAVRYRTRAVDENPDPEIRDLDKAIEDLNDAIQTNRKNAEMLAKRSVYMDQLEGGFIQPSIKNDLSRGVLDAKSVEMVSSFSFEQRKNITNELLALDKKYKELSKDLATKETNRAKMSKANTRTVREALLFVDKQKPGAESIRLNYLVSKCGWLPSYTFRAGKDRKEVAFEYNALIQQVSGESWEGVKLTLSTASPTLSAAGPGLGPFNIMLSTSTTSAQAVQRDLASQLKSIVSRQEAALAQTQTAISMAESIGSSWSANAIANEFQVLELISRFEAWTALQPSDLNIGEGTSIVYPPLPAVTLTSRSDQQIVRIMAGNLKSKFYNVATPVLTNFVYREAELTNSSTADLLGGTITVYLDGRFVGRGEIPTVGVGQTFTVGFGVDPQVRVYRTLVSREEKAQGANRQLNLKYELKVENFKEEPVALQLFDRYPYYTNEADIRVRLGDLTDKLSDDTLYKNTEYLKNILRWDVEIPGNATAGKAKKIEYAFSVEFPQNRTLSSVGVSTTPTAAGAAVVPTSELQQEFEALQRARQGGTNAGSVGGGRGGAASAITSPSSASGSRG